MRFSVECNDNVTFVVIAILFKWIIWLLLFFFLEYAYSLSVQELDEKIDAIFMSVHYDHS